VRGSIVILRLSKIPLTASVQRPNIVVAINMRSPCLSLL